jgi:hypothetical protein
MARIQQYTAQVDLPFSVNAPRATAADFGADDGTVGKTLDKVGDVLTDYFAKQKAKQEKDANWEVEVATSNSRVEWMERMEKAKSMAGPGGIIPKNEELGIKEDIGFSDYIKNEITAYNAKQRDDRKEAPESAQHLLMLRQNQLYGNLLSHSMAFEAGARAQKLRVDAGVLADNFTKEAFYDYGNFETSRDAFHQSIDKLNLPAAEKHELKAKYTGDAAVAGIRGMIQNGRLSAAEAALKEGEFAPHISGANVAALSNQIDAERKRIEAQGRAVSAQALSVINSATNTLASGYDLPPETQTAVSSAVRSSGDPLVRSAYMEMKALQQDTMAWNKMTPTQLGDVVNVLNQAARTDGATNFELQRLTMATRLRDNLARMVETNPLYAATVQGIVPAGPPLDMNDQKTVEARVARADAVGKLYGNTAFFDEIEAKNEARKFEGMQPQQQIEYVTRLNASAGHMAVPALAQLSKHNMTIAYAGGLAAVDPASAEKALMGRRMIQENPASRPSSERTTAAFNTFMNGAQMGLPGEVVRSMKEMADGIYVANGGDPKMIGSDYDKAIKQAIGTLGGDGIANINGTQMLLPPGSTRREFESFMGNASDDTWKSASLNRMPPVTRDGTPISSTDMANNAQFKMTRPNIYEVYFRGENVLDSSGGKYTVKITPQMLKRR